MNYSLYLSRNDRLRILFEMIFMKFIYIVCTASILPETYLLWTYGKEIKWDNIFFELIPFILVCIMFVNQFRRNNDFSFLATLFFILFYIPANSCLVLSNYSVSFYVLINIFSTLMLFLIGKMAVRHGKETNKIKEGNSSWIEDVLFENQKFLWIFRLIMLVVCALTILYVYNYNSLNFSVLFSEMYSVRADYAEYAVQIQGTTASYLSLIITKVSGWLLPIYLYFALSKKKPIDIFICLFTFIANYTVEMQKTSLFIIFVVIFAVILKSKDKLHISSEYLIKGFLILFAFSFIEYLISGDSVMYNLVLRRLTYVPAYLSNTYYEFFSMNKKIWFTQDVFVIQQIARFFIDRPYEGSTVEVISRNCFSGRLASPNTGIFAEAYAQMGIVGIFVFPFIDCFVLKKMKIASDVFGVGIPIVVLSKLCFTFLNNFTLTTATLIGIIIFIIIAKIVVFLTGNIRNTVSKESEGIYNA